MQPNYPNYSSSGIDRLEAAVAGEGSRLGRSTTEAPTVQLPKPCRIDWSSRVGA